MDLFDSLSETALHFPGFQDCFQELIEQAIDFPGAVMDDMDGERDTISGNRGSWGLDYTGRSHVWEYHIELPVHYY